MISETFSENKWYVNLLFGITFLYFLYFLIQGLFPLIHPPYESPLVPFYANYFIAIHAMVVFIKSLAGAMGIIFLYQKKKVGWVLTASAVLAILSILTYYMIVEMTFFFVYEEVLCILVAVYLFGKRVRTEFGITYLNAVFPVLFSLTLVMIESGAFPLSMKIAALIG